MFGRALKNMVFTRSMSQQASPINVDALKIIHEPSAKCFVMKLNSDSATVTYEKEGNIYNLLESEVPESLRGKGFGTILAKNTFDYMIENKMTIKLECDFLKKFYRENHNAYKDYVVE